MRKLTSTFYVHRYLGFLLLTVLTCTAQSSFSAPKSAANIGHWSNVVNWPNVALHSVLMPNKEVFTFGTDKKGKQGAQLFYDVWDPKKGTGANSHRTLPNITGTDIFCTAPAIIPETGDILLAGGDVRVKGSINVGIKDAFEFNTKSRVLKPTTSMASARWYATATALANGEILVHGGRAGKKQPIIVPEIYNPKNKKWRSLPGAGNTNIISLKGSSWFYPRNFLIPDGRIFGFTSRGMYYLSTQGKGSNTLAGSLPGKPRNTTSTAVMYEPGKILQLGGGGTPATKQAITIDVTGKKPVVKNTGSLQYGRSWANSTMLPTGEVLVTGGSAVKNKLKGVAEAAEIWNPDTQKWKSLAKAKLARLYHSSALLLPDTKILVAGGGSPGPVLNLNAEIFSPPYLFNSDGSLAKRLQIINAPAATNLGKNITVKYAIGKGQQKAVRATLIRLGSATHSFNMEQRFIELNLQQDGADQVNLKIPGSANYAPPGFYMLFLLDQNDRPSDAHILKINVPGGNAGNTNANDGTPQLNIGDLLVSEDSSTATVTVSLQPASKKWVNITVTTANNTATAGKDYTARNILLKFRPGETTKDVLIPIKDDTDKEEDETFEVILSKQKNAEIGIGIAQVTILANDGGGKPNSPTLEFGVAANDLTVDESVDTAQVTITLTPASNKKITVEYSTKPETATSGGADFRGKTGTVTFNPGETSKTAEIRIVNDNKAEQDETFLFRIMSANTTIADKTATVTIIDDDNPSYNGSNNSTLPEIVILNTNTQESSGEVKVTVKLKSVSNEPVTVFYKTANKSAKSGSDYFSKNGKITFKPGQLKKFIFVNLIQDSKSELTEKFNIVLNDPTNATIGRDTATIQITD